MKNFEIAKILNDAGCSVCPVCAMPFVRKRADQITCGEKECQRLWNIQRTKDRARLRYEEDPDAERKRRREAMQRYRRRKSHAKLVMQNSEEWKERWQRQTEFDRKIKEYGLHYGDVSAQKVLEQVPKIDVTNDPGAGK